MSKNLVTLSLSLRHRTSTNNEAPPPHRLAYGFGLKRKVVDKRAASSWGGGGGLVGISKLTHRGQLRPGLMMSSLLSRLPGNQEERCCHYGHVGILSVKAKVEGERCWCLLSEFSSIQRYGDHSWKTTSNDSTYSSQPTLKLISLVVQNYFLGEVLK